MPFSTALNTTVSNFEAAQNYKDVQDPAVVVAFPLRDDPETNLLAWTTTPWTLPSNVALAAHPDLEYIKIVDEKSGKTYILMEALLKTLYKDPKKAKFKILERFNGKHMLGWKYEPLFPYFYEKFKEHGFRVLNALYVTADSGVGIVHQSPAFGEEDYNVAMQHGVISESRHPPNPIDDSGCFTNEVPLLEGQYVKTAGMELRWTILLNLLIRSTDKAIIKYLKSTGRLVADSTIFHSYPFCWRSDVWKTLLIAVLLNKPPYRRLYYTEPSHPGLSRFHQSSPRCWRISRNRIGSPALSKRKDSPIGSHLREIGTSLEIDIGPFLDSAAPALMNTDVV